MPRAVPDGELAVGRARRGEAPVGVRQERSDAYHSRDGQCAVQMREHHLSRVARHTGFPPDRRGEACGIDAKQHQIRATGVQPVGRKVNLLGRGQMNKPDGVQRVGPEFSRVLGTPPVVTGAQMDEDADVRNHIQGNTARDTLSQHRDR